MTYLLIAHLVAALVAPVLVRWLRRWAFVALAVVPAASFGWLVGLGPRVSGGGSVDETHRWVPALDLELAFRLTTLSWVLALMVTSIGALVLFYCTFYFADGDTHAPRFSAVLTAFAGAMLGLILADDLLLLYVFWELTTVFSYLLIGHDPERRANRRAAMQALMVTTFGGLAMLVGIIVLGTQAGTYRISAILADPPVNGMVTAAVLLLLVGALSKSALVPFQFWLPGAMAAPTPVSAYLHAAAMVKAGVYLVALLAPAYAGTPGWRPTVLGLGVATMLLGGLRALRQNDIKLLLAFGTVSQLGFLVTVVGLGTRSAAIAGVAMVLAHALFKSSLFLVVGVVDHQAGTRDLRELSGLWRTMPVAFGAAVAAGASMAALPPLTGWVAKESVLAAFVDVTDSGDGTGIGTVSAILVLTGLVAGSALTVAYTARFVWGAFATKPGVGPTDVERPSVGFLVPPVLLATAGLVVGFLGRQETRLLQPYAEQFPPGAHDTELALWHGFEPGLWLSLAAIALGGALFWRRDLVTRAQDRVRGVPDAGRTYDAVMRGVDRLSVETTALTQRGSLSLYLGAILLVLVILPGGAAFLTDSWPASVRAWDTPAQAVVGAVMVAAAVLAVRSRRRLKAVMLIGVTGYGAAVLFLLHGAPDLALTQVLVESVTLVVFVLVLRYLPSHFSDRPRTSSRWWRLAIALLVGGAVAGFALVSTGARTVEPVSVGYPGPALDFGGGKNIVNVTLVDIRAWDTLGEASVLIVAATGIASLVFVITRRGEILSPTETPRRPGKRSKGKNRGNLWLRGGATLEAARRSVIFEVVTRLVFHTMIVFSLFLLFSGHNAPGGGFAGGLVAGLALFVRYLAGGRHELDDAAPVDAGLLLGVGIVLCAATGIAAVLAGGDVLQSAILKLDVPLLGEVKFVTSLIFDIGVYLVVIGLMLDIVRSLGSGIDRQLEDRASELEAAR